MCGAGNWNRALCMLDKYSNMWTASPSLKPFEEISVSKFYRVKINMCTLGFKLLRVVHVVMCSLPPCMCLRMCMCECICMSLCLCVFEYKCMWVYVCTYVCVHYCVLECTWMCIHMWQLEVKYLQSLLYPILRQGLSLTLQPMSQTVWESNSGILLSYSHCFDFKDAFLIFFEIKE